MATPPTFSPPGSIHKLTHRTTGGVFLLRPDDPVTQLFLYLLGYLCELYQIRPHLAILLSNHLHILLTDVLGDRIQFFNTHFFSLFANALNTYRGRGGNVFDPEGPNCVHVCPRAEDLVQHGTYVSMNAVEAELVARAKQWPGARVLPHGMGRVRLEIERPKFYFDPKGSTPERVVLEFSIPEAIDCKPEELRERMIVEHNRLEREKREELIRENRKFMGRKAIRRQSIHARPKEEPALFERIPHVACLDRTLRKKMLEWRKRRNRRYRAILEQIRSGLHDVCLPLGSWYQHFRNGFEREPWGECIWQQLMDGT